VAGFALLGALRYSGHTSRFGGPAPALTWVVRAVGRLRLCLL